MGLALKGSTWRIEAELFSPQATSFSQYIYRPNRGERLAEAQREKYCKYLANCHINSNLNIIQRTGRASLKTHVF